jgi:hypothetical protein
MERLVAVTISAVSLAVAVIALVWVTGTASVNEMHQPNYLSLDEEFWGKLDKSQIVEIATSAVSAHEETASHWATSSESFVYVVQLLSFFLIAQAIIVMILVFARRRRNRQPKPGA